VPAPSGRSEVVEIGAHRRHKKQQQQHYIDVVWLYRTSAIFELKDIYNV